MSEEERQSPFAQAVAAQKFNKPLIGANSSVGGPRNIALAEMGEVRSYSAEALRFLASIVRNDRVETKLRVSAAARVLTHGEAREQLEAGPMKDLIAILGSDRAALEWMRSKIPALEAKLGIDNVTNMAEAKQLLAANPHLVDEARKDAEKEGQ